MSVVVVVALVGVDCNSSDARAGGSDDPTREECDGRVWACSDWSRRFKDGRAGLRCEEVVESGGPGGEGVVVAGWRDGRVLSGGRGGREGEGTCTRQLGSCEIQHDNRTGKGISGVWFGVYRSLRGLVLSTGFSTPHIVLLMR